MIAQGEVHNVELGCSMHVRVGHAPNALRKRKHKSVDRPFAALNSLLQRFACGLQHRVESVSVLKVTKCIRQPSLSPTKQKEIRSAASVRILSQSTMPLYALEISCGPLPSSKLSELGEGEREATEGGGEERGEVVWWWRR